MSSRELAKQWGYRRYSQYEAELRKTAADWFRSEGYETNEKYPFILKDFSQWPQNIILEEVVQYIQDEQKRQKAFPLHKYIHHGLSSQAMVFNLVGPMIVKSDLEPLISLIRKKGIVMNAKNYKAEFEYDDREVFNEDTGQATSIDLVLKDESDEPVVFIESKLVEKEFGGCSVYQQGDCDGRNPIDDLSGCYLDFIGRKYWALIKDLGFAETCIGTDSSCVLVNNYQYFRELLFALEKGGVYILLYDERNPAFYNYNGVKMRGLMDYLRGLTPEKYHNRIADISIQELVDKISLSKGHGWINKFRAKYGLS